MLQRTRGGADYHPDTTDLWQYGPQYIARQLRANAARRAALKRDARELLARARKDHAMVCMADSIIAGNCAIGSTQWAQRHDLDPARHYPAHQIAKLDTSSRVQIVIARAIQRTAQEARQGFCQLENHGR